MSIASEIARLSKNVSDSLDAVAAKGVTVPSGSNSDDLPELISQITGGGGSGGIVYQDENGFIVLDPNGGGPTVTGIAINGGTFTVESSYSGTKTIAHGLGKKPSVMCIYPITSKSNDSGTYAGVGGYAAYGTLNLSNVFPSTISIADPSQSIEVFTGVGFYLPPNQNTLSPYTETLYQFGSVYILEPDSTNIYYAIPSGEGVILGGVEYRWWAVCSDG